MKRRRFISGHARAHESRANLKIRKRSTCCAQNKRHSNSTDASSRSQTRTSGTCPPCLHHPRPPFRPRREAGWGHFRPRAVAESTQKFSSDRPCLAAKPRFACPPSRLRNHIRHRPSPLLSDKESQSSPHVISIALVAAKRFEFLAKINHANRASPIRQSALTKTTKTKSLMSTPNLHLYQSPINESLIMTL